MEKYYFKVERTLCLESCPVIPDLRIGSSACKSCANNEVCNYEENFIVCKKLPKQISRTLYYKVSDQAGVWEDYVRMPLSGGDGLRLLFEHGKPHGVTRADKTVFSNPEQLLTSLERTELTPDVWLDKFKEVMEFLTGLKQ